MSTQGFTHGLQDTDARSVGAAAPVAEKMRGFSEGFLVPELSKVFLQIIGDGKWFVELQGFFRTLLFVNLSLGGKILRIPQ